MKGKSGNARDGATIIIRREEGGGAGHHGGAWKVAYADFVTAMMAFFLLMWLLNATSQEQRQGLADYFTPSNALSRASSGSGKPFGGRTPFSEGQLVSDRGAQAVIPGHSEAPQEQDDPESDLAAQLPATTSIERSTRGDKSFDPSGSAARAASTQAQAAGEAQAMANAGSGVNTPAGPTIDTAALKAELERRERAAFDAAAQQIRDAVRADPQIADLANQLAIDQTPEGLRIQLLDEERRPMFASGSAVLNDRARLLLQKVVPVLMKLPEKISVSGHTDAAPYKGGEKTNWDLSSERANATRRLMVESGLSEQRFRSVSGNADRDLLLPADPLAAANRRIAITVLRAAR